MKLYTSWFSPFARKIALILEHKNLPYEAVDGLARSSHTALRSVNERVEVPVLEDDGLIVVNSSDIAQYLEMQYPDIPVYPTDIGDRVEARALERLSDTLLDAIIVNCSLWSWADRSDSPPEGMMDAAQRDLDTIWERLEQALNRSPSDFFSETPGIVEFSFFPHMSAVRALGFAIDADRYPRVKKWLQAMRALPICRHDLRRTRDFMKTLQDSDYERQKIAWRGDRMEWMMVNGFHEWLMGEIKADRVIWPR